MMTVIIVMMMLIVMILMTVTMMMMNKSTYQEREWTPAVGHQVTFLPTLRS